MLDSTAKIKLLIISNEPLARAGLSSLLEAEADFEIIGQLDSGNEVEHLEKVFNPDLVLWDLGLESSLGDDEELQNELEQISMLSSEGFSIVVLISVPDSARDVWLAGAKAILLRDVRLEVLRAAILATASGMVTFDESISAHLLPELGDPGRLPREELTPRELEVLQKLAEGVPNKIIAIQLGISEHTIKFHVNHIFKKLGVRSRTEAVVRGAQLGLIVL